MARGADVKSKSKIFIVDDETTNIELAASILKDDYNIIPITSGERVFKSLEKHQAELILLDINMPGMNGYEVIEKLKEDPATQKIPIIFLTGLSDHDAIIKGFELGAQDYIVKPFNRAELKARVENHLEIFQLNNSLQEKVDEQTLNLQDKYEKLKVAKLEAEQASIAKSEFISNMNHEIKTPMNAIIGFNQLAMQTSGLPKEVQGYLQGIKTAADNLMGIIHNTLSFSEILQNKCVVKNDLFYIDKILDSIVEVFEPKVSVKGLKLLIEREEVHNCYLGDIELLQKLLHNLVDNAVKFTHAGTVRCRVYENNGRVHFEIIDTGIGISQENIDSLFQAFQQGDGSSKREFGGIGLGLNLSKQLTELMDGSLEVQSELQKGSSFTLSLPLEAVACEESYESKYLHMLEQEEVSTTTQVQSVETFDVDLEMLFAELKKCVDQLSRGESIDDDFERIQDDLQAIASYEEISKIQNYLEIFEYESAEENLRALLVENGAL